MNDDWKPTEGMRYIAPDGPTPRKMFDGLFASAEQFNRSMNQAAEATRGQIAALDELSEWAKRLRVEHPECPKDAPILDWLIEHEAQP